MNREVKVKVAAKKVKKIMRTAMKNAKRLKTKARLAGIKVSPKKIAKIAVKKAIRRHAPKLARVLKKKAKRAQLKRIVRSTPLVRVKAKKLAAVGA
jgi:hypothetical protein